MKPIVLVMALVLFPFSNLIAEVITPNSNIAQDCGSKINTNDVMVLDVESFSGDVGAAMQFIDKHAGKYVLASETQEHIKTKWSHPRYDRDSAIKRATKEAAKRGCDLLIILSAGTEIVGVNDSGGFVKKGTAVVMMGDRSDEGS